MIGGTTPRNFSPCGVCVDQNQPVLMADIGSVYGYFNDAPLSFVEALLIPWGAEGGSEGTLWIVSHTDRRHYDREDVRLMNCMAAFVAGAIRLKQTTLTNEHAVISAHLVSQMAHHINNPLQAAVLALYSARSQNEMSPAVREMLDVAAAELQRVTQLSAALLQQLYLPQM